MRCRWFFWTLGGVRDDVCSTQIDLPPAHVYEWHLRKAVTALISAVFASGKSFALLRGLDEPSHGPYVASARACCVLRAARLFVSFETRCKRRRRNLFFEGR